MKIYTIFIFLFLSNIEVSNAQYPDLVNSGYIDFEKSTNTHAVIKRILGNNPDITDIQKFEQYKAMRPQFRRLKSRLTFHANKTSYIPDSEENSIDVFDRIPMIMQNNFVYVDYTKKSFVSQKKVFEETFLVKDNINKIAWKITGETREIEGYLCRRANAIIMDSVYVVAFYTDKIPISGGPESFSGLPGMILEVAMPHHNVIWKAIKIVSSTSEISVLPPKTGKPVDDETLRKFIKSVLKNGNSYSKNSMIAFFL